MQLTVQDARGTYDARWKLTRVRRNPVNELYRDVQTLAETEMLEAAAASGHRTLVGAFLPPLSE
jgi:hypothetical protein